MDLARSLEAGVTQAEHHVFQPFVPSTDHWNAIVVKRIRRDVARITIARIGDTRAHTDLLSGVRHQPPKIGRLTHAIALTARKHRVSGLLDS